MVTRFIVLSLLFGLAAGCGGGGGGGGGRSTGVRVINAAIDAYPIDIIGSDGAISSAKFSFTSDRVATPKKDQSALVTRTGNIDTPIFSIAADDIKSKTAMVYGNRESLGLRLAQFNDDAGDIPSGKCALRIVHGLNGASAVSANLGDIDLGQAAFGSASAYQYVDAGAYTLKVKRVSDALTVYSGGKAFEAGKAYTLLVTGQTGYLVLANTIQD